MRILLLSRWFPYPADNGSKIRIFNILRSLSRRHEVSLISFADCTDRVDGDSVHAVRRYCASVRVLPYRGFRPTSARALAGFFSSKPRSLVDVYSHQMKSAIAEEVSIRSPDLIVASELEMAPYAIDLQGLPLALDDLELSLIRDAAMRASPFRPRALLTWLKLSFYLRGALPRFAACTVVSENERANVQSLAPSYRNLEVIPNAVDLSDYDDDFGAPRRNTLVFLGALTYRPNHDGVLYFIREIYPRILASMDDVTLRVTGDVSGIDPAALPSCRGVEYTGHVNDVRPVVARSWVSVVPIRLGGGTRLKIIESMALGTPVVSTSKGAEGLDVADGVNILIADEPKDFAARVVQLLESPALRRKLAAGGRRLVMSKYNWRTSGEKLDALIEWAASSEVSH
jgi:glycosyltransferase involved in cell wall biosynthesis